MVMGEWRVEQRIVPNSTMSSLPRLKVLEVILRGIGLSCQIYTGVPQRILNDADARSKNALVNFKEVFHTAVLPSSHSSPLMPCPNLWLHEQMSVLLSSSTTSYISLVSLTPKTTTSVSMVQEEYSVMSIYHSSSVWFFLIGTDMAIATDVDGDDWRALSLIPAPLAPLKVGLMATAVMANNCLSISLGINHWKGQMI